MLRQKGVCVVPRCIAGRAQPFLGMQEWGGQCCNTTDDTGVSFLKDIERQEVFYWRGGHSDLSTRETLARHALTELVLLKEI